MKAGKVKDIGRKLEGVEVIVKDAEINVANLLFSPDEVIALILEYSRIVYAPGD